MDSAERRELRKRGCFEQSNPIPKSNSRLCNKTPYAFQTGGEGGANEPNRRGGRGRGRKPADRDEEKPDGPVFGANEANGGACERDAGVMPHSPRRVVGFVRGRVGSGARWRGAGVEVALDADQAASDSAGALAKADVNPATVEGRGPGRIAASDVPKTA